MGNLWFGLPEAVKFFFMKPKLTEKNYEPLLMLEEMGQGCLDRIGDKPVELIFDIDKNLPAKLRGDADRLRQVLMCLLENSIGFAEKGYVRLLIKVYPVPENEMIELHISVKDTGKGIDSEKMGRLFSFRIPRGRSKGDGVSNELFVCQRLIGSMGGEIHVKSEEGRGSEFWFSIQQKIVDSSPAAYIKRSENGRVPKVSAKFSNQYREAALMSLLNMYKISFIPYDILQDVGMMADYIFTDHGVYYESEQEMMELVRRRENICVLENPLRDHKKLDGVTICYRPFFSLNFCRFLSQI
ncbi:MAG: ATP-binding protein [Eubacterium sp.]|nr:ATP-binding protein [Eubacterium sp.]MCM1305019.1 ATP-binding protein [Butyrivibrio sp.]MCM1344098.1 ATP-binding protein [Muribaculaceae bacterium]MCM1412026.1 ATP-binding protein [Lachnospiraceae bacterium]